MTIDDLAERIDAQATRFDTIDTRFTSLDVHINDLAASTAKGFDDFAILMANGFKELRDDMDAGFEGVDQRLTTIEYKLDQHAVDIKSLSRESGRTNTRVGALETEVFGSLRPKGA